MRASSVRNKIIGVAGTIGTAVGVAGTATAVMATGPFSVPAAIAGSRLLAAGFIFGGGVSGLTTALKFGNALADWIPGLNSRRTAQ